MAIEEDVVVVFLVVIAVFVRSRLSRDCSLKAANRMFCFRTFFFPFNKEEELNLMIEMFFNMFLALSIKEEKVGAGEGFGLVQRALDTSGRGEFEHFFSTTHTIKKKIKKIIIISKGSYFKSRCACFFFCLFDFSGHCVRVLFVGC